MQQQYSHRPGTLEYPRNSLMNFSVRLIGCGGTTLTLLKRAEEIVTPFHFNGPRASCSNLFKAIRLQFRVRPDHPFAHLPNGLSRTS